MKQLSGLYTMIVGVWIKFPLSFLQYILDLSPPGIHSP